MTKPLPPDVPRKPKGSKPGERRGGRKAGTPNKRTIGREALLQVPTTPLTRKQAKEGTNKQKYLTPLEFLTKIYTSEATGKNRIPLGYQLDAAKAAAPYVHAKKIAVVSKNVNLNVPAATTGEGGAIDADALYRDIMGADDDEAEG